MPWADIVIVLLIVIAAYIGYTVGLLGAFKGFISKIVGLLGAWLLTPLALAWLEGKWGVEAFLAELIRGRIPAPLMEAIRGLAQTARTFQELREGLMAMPMPPEVALYLQRTMDKAPPSTVPSPEIAAYMLTKEIAQSIMWAFLFVLIWMILAILIKGFMSMIFIGGDGKTIIGVFDGVLGTVVTTFILVAFLVVFSGVVFPVILITKPDGGFAKIYPYLLDSGLIRGMARVYQLYIVPWIG